jgi:hypothetical protein
VQVINQAKSQNEAASQQEQQVAKEALSYLRRHAAKVKLIQNKDNKKK